ncbi:uncharacterized protein LOC143301332 [Babylonia areolata]|uniref:uncharacterized protein LOC143301332 n=1 Tax=Babylonia areolata TaxID=304850 RepID=UPI003FD6135C
MENDSPLSRVERQRPPGTVRRQSPLGTQSLPGTEKTSSTVGRQSPSGPPGPDKKQPSPFSTAGRQNSSRTVEGQRQEEPTTSAAPTLGKPSTQPHRHKQNTNATTHSPGHAYSPITHSGPDLPETNGKDDRRDFTNTPALKIAPRSLQPRTETNNATKDHREESAGKQTPTEPSTEAKEAAAAAATPPPPITPRSLSKDAGTPGKSSKAAFTGTRDIISHTHVTERQDTEAVRRRPDDSRTSARVGATAGGGLYKKKALSRGGRVEKVPPDFTRNKNADSSQTAESKASTRTAAAASTLSRDTSSRAGSPPGRSDDVFPGMTSVLTSQTASDVIGARVAALDRDGFQADNSLEEERGSKVYSDFYGSLKVSDV